MEFSPVSVISAFGMRAPDGSRTIIARFALREGAGAPWPEAMTTWKFKRLSKIAPQASRRNAPLEKAIGRACGWLAITGVNPNYRLSAGTLRQNDQRRISKSFSGLQPFDPPFSPPV